MRKIEQLSRKILRPKFDNTKGNSRSTPKGRIVNGCPECAGIMIIKMVDRFNTQTECNGCGLIDNMGIQTISQRGK